MLACFTLADGQSRQVKKYEKEKMLAIAELNSSMKDEVYYYEGDSITFLAVPKEYLKKLHAQYTYKGTSVALQGYEYVIQLVNFFSFFDESYSDSKRNLKDYSIKYPNLNLSGYQKLIDWKSKKKHEKRKVDSIAKSKPIQIIANKPIAQNPWENLEMDSTSFFNIYGETFQYLYQNDLQNKSTHKTLCLFTGAKKVWLLYIGYFLGSEGYNIALQQNEASIVLVATHKIIVGKQTPVKITGAFNKQDKVTSVTITGSPDDIIPLFINYWELTGVSLNFLKSKGSLTKDFLSDRVSISWLGENPVIKVTKNPSAVVDFFKF